MSGKFYTVSFEVFGKVQGVFFRKHTKKTAQKLELVGWVKNTGQKTVTGCVQGKKENVTKMKHWLQFDGSPKSTITRCEFKDQVTVENTQFEGFEIRR